MICSSSRVSTEADAYRRGTTHPATSCLSCNAYARRCHPLPFSAAIFAGGCSPRSRWSACKFPRGAAGAEMSRAGVFCAPRRLIQSKRGTAWSSARALSYLHLPLVNLLFQPRFFYTFPSFPPLPLQHPPTLALLLRMFFNRPHVFFLGGWRANCRGRHVRNFRYGNSLRFQRDPEIRIPDGGTSWNAIYARKLSRLFNPLRATCKSASPEIIDKRNDKCTPLTSVSN